MYDGHQRLLVAQPIAPRKLGIAGLTAKMEPFSEPRLGPIATTGLLLNRQVDTESGSLSGLATGPNGPAVIGHHFLTDGQADAGAVKFAPTVQPLKELKDPLNDAVRSLETRMSWL